MPGFSCFVADNDIHSLTFGSHRSYFFTRNMSSRALEPASLSYLNQKGFLTCISGKIEGKRGKKKKGKEREGKGRERKGRRGEGREDWREGKRREIRKNDTPKYKMGNCFGIIHFPLNLFCKHALISNCFHSTAHD